MEKKKKENVIKIRYKRPETRLRWNQLVAYLKYIEKAETFEQALDYLMKLEAKTREVEVVF